MKKNKAKERIFDIIKCDPPARSKGPKHPQFAQCLRAAMKLPKGKALRFLHSKEMLGLAQALNRSLKKEQPNKYFTVSRTRDMFRKYNAVLLYRKN